MPADPVRLGEAFGYPYPDFDIAGYAVRNLGCVHLRFDDRALHIHFRPARIRLEAMIDTFFETAQEHPPRIVLGVFETTWRYEVFTDLTAVFQRMEDLVAASSAIAHRPSYSAKDLGLNALTRAAGNETLKELITLWYGTNGVWKADMLGRQMPTLLGSRSIMLKQPRRSNRLIVDFHGHGFSFYQRCWGLLAIGRDFEDQPDRAYATEVAVGYRRALAEDRPRFEAVDALISPPGGTARRSRYDRLILPWRSADGSRFLSSTSVLRAVRAAI